MAIPNEHVAVGINRSLDRSSEVEERVVFEFDRDDNTQVRLIVPFCCWRAKVEVVERCSPRERKV